MEDKFVVKVSMQDSTRYLYGLPCQTIMGDDVVISATQAIDDASKFSTMDDAKMLRDKYIENIRENGWRLVKGTEICDSANVTFDLVIVKVTTEDVLTQVLVKA